MTLAGYLSPLFDATEVQSIALLGLTYPAQIILHLLFIIYWLFKKTVLGIPSLLILLAEIFIVHFFINFQYLSANNESVNSFKVASLNFQFSKDLLDDGPDERKLFNDFIKNNNDIDILCVQECGPLSKNFMTRDGSFPFEYFPESSMVGIYSKYPMIHQEFLAAGLSNANPCVWADILINKDTVRVYSVHLEPNRFDGKVPEHIDYDSPEKQSFTVMFGIIMNYNIFSAQRAEQARLIHKHLEESPYPSLVCGDFNDIPLSRVYSCLSDNLKDSYRQRGKGFGASLRSYIPGMRIDYILGTKNLKIHKHEVYKKTFSDHYLIKADLSL